MKPSFTNTDKSLTDRTTCERVMHEMEYSTRRTFSMSMAWGVRADAAVPAAKRSTDGSQSGWQAVGPAAGNAGQSKLDGQQEEVKTLLALRVSKASIAKIMGVNCTTLYHIIRSRRLVSRD